jgi:hypothetical protein|tara:strand:- start:72 stop:245 length:174 start_codon:yes stop_codon:yes gene_type:complete
MNRHTLISIAEQGRSVREGSSVTDGATTFFELIAASAALQESRMTLSSESICTDARY